MDVLLGVVHDFLKIVRDVFDVQTKPAGVVHDEMIVGGPNRRVQVVNQQRDDNGLIGISDGHPLILARAR